MMGIWHMIFHGYSCYSKSINGFWWFQSTLPLFWTFPSHHISSISTFTESQPVSATLSQASIRYLGEPRSNHATCLGCCLIFWGGIIMYYLILFSNSLRKNLRLLAHLPRLEPCGTTGRSRHRRPAVMSTTASKHRPRSSVSTKRSLGRLRLGIWPNLAQNISDCFKDELGARLASWCRSNLLLKREGHCST